MLFTDEYDHTIDAKQRLAIPAEVRSMLDRQNLGTAFYLAPGPNGALWLWPQRTFEQMAAALQPTFLPAGEMMEFEQLLFSQTTRVELDKTGRIRLPGRLLQRFGLGTSVTILGVNDHLELRNTAQWRQVRDQMLDQDKQAEIIMRARQAWEEQRRGGQEDRP